MLANVTECFWPLKCAMVGHWIRSHRWKLLVLIYVGLAMGDCMTLDLSATATTISPKGGMYDFGPTILFRKLFLELVVSRYKIQLGIWCLASYKKSLCSCGILTPLYCNE